MLDNGNFDQEILEKKNVALITFTADWCRPCLLQKPVIKNLAERYANRAVIESIDVDSHEELANRYGARTLPTTVLFAQGEIIETLAGYQSEEFLISYLDMILAEVAKAAQDS
ncbi:MAG: thiol reductase thioredoxin [Candidatus Riflebacteria bacterium HGW-Riflebacteria-2]|jgi:thioredoxin-like negative regulator of GroEL|nr:MAG: thiol reductase thioredoxin [Candidatus Riflebacteria bacterium HGW-Riflebacteria-2]